MTRASPNEPSRLDRLARALVSGAVLGLGVWLLWHLMSQPQGAHARIYLDWIAPLEEGVPPVDGEGTSLTGVHESTVNGRVLRYTVEETSENYLAYLDEREAELRSDCSLPLLSTLPPGSDPSMLWPDLDDRHFSRWKLERPVARIVGDGWGGLAYFDAVPDEDGAPGIRATRTALERFEASGDAADLGTLRSLVAIDDRSSGSTTVFHIWSPGGFDITGPSGGSRITSPWAAQSEFDPPESCNIEASYSKTHDRDAARLAAFHCAQDCERVLSDSADVLMEHGWYPVPSNGSVGRNSAIRGVRFDRDGREFFFMGSGSPGSGACRLIAFEIGTDMGRSEPTREGNPR